MENQLFNLLMYAVPTLITGAIAVLAFREFTNNEDKRRRFLLHKDLQNQALPLRLQAYERMALFLERISPPKLLVRVQPTSPDKNTYETLLVSSIEQEFDHNLTQQIYITTDCWNVINASKNATIQLIRQAAMNEKADSADKLREVILNYLIDKETPSQTGLAFIKKEVAEVF